VRNVCVLGLGLIGGSVLRAAGASGRTVWGATASATDGRAAAADGFAIEPTVRAALRRARDTDALVVIAVPLPALREVIDAIAETTPDCLLTDVISVKGPVRAAVARSLSTARYAGGHPMAGRSKSGWSAGDAALFDKAAWVVTTDDVDIAAWTEAARLAIDCGAHVVPATAADHDVAVGRVSHLPHVLAAVLASVGADGGPLALALAAGSFRDGSRVAGSRPELVRAMCEGNRDALLTALDDALGRLGAARGSLASTGSLTTTLANGNKARQAFDGLDDGTNDKITVQLDAPGALDELAALGLRGGRVVAIDGSTALAEVPPGP
jgi:prephenate dehydrogenase